ncbi:MAG TPA: DUF5319 domain-containing protein [Mycobacteriales bacterium]|nr:DUF5319 domain-containing protein [Mycobacteriales bacterium]
MRDDPPLDPFAGDPSDPAAELSDEELGDEPLTDDERRNLLEDLEDLEMFQALLEPRGVRGMIIDCPDCREDHYYGWALLRANLRNILEAGAPHVHEPAYQPDPADYVTWDYARGFTDGVLTADE